MTSNFDRQQQYRDAVNRARIEGRISSGGGMFGWIGGLISSIWMAIWVLLIGAVVLVIAGIAVAAGIHSLTHHSSSLRKPLVAGTYLGHEEIQVNLKTSYKAFPVPAATTTSATSKQSYVAWSKGGGLRFSTPIALRPGRMPGSAVFSQDDPCARSTWRGGGGNIPWSAMKTATIVCARVKDTGGYSDTLVSLSADPNHDFINIDYTTWVGPRTTK